MTPTDLIKKVEGLGNVVLDRRGIPIERGDIVKVFHFIGARRKRYFMYKQCLGPQFLHPSHSEPYMMFSHLNFVEDRKERDGPYHERLGQKLDRYEIVQSLASDYETRPRLRSLEARDKGD